MNKKKLLFIGTLILGAITFAGGDLNLSSEIPICGTKIVEKYEADPQNEVRTLIGQINENEKQIEEEYNSPEKNWDEIQRLTKEGGKLKGNLEYLILSRN